MFWLKYIKKLLYPTKERLIKCIQRAFMYICRLFPINQKKAVFSSYGGTSFDDNPKAIYMEMVKQRPDWKYIWLMPDNKIRFRHAEVAKRGSLLALYHLSTARLWVDNCRKESQIVKRKGQYYVQTWHAGVALKKVEKDTEETLCAEYIAKCKNDSKMADLFTAGCRWCAENFKNAFWYDGEILQIGLPRSDIFYKSPAPFKEKVCSYFGLPKDVKLCLYVPTFRNSSDLSCYNIDYHRLKAALEKKWGGEWKILVRLHPNIRDRQSGVLYDQNIINASPYNEVNELTTSSDLVITDYSSCMFDALEAGKKVLLYAADMKEYLKERQFYFKLRELPFLLAQNNDELEENIIMHFDEKVYIQKTADFRERLGLCNSAHGSEKVVSYILRKLEGGKHQ